MIRNGCYILGVLFLLILANNGMAQGRLPGKLGSIGGNLRSAGGGGGSDTLQRRTGLEDSITISFRYLDSTRLYKMDTSINDFTRRFPIPADHIFLGNLGNATRSLTFNPLMKPGFDAGFHAFDVYKFTLEETKFFTTTRPYTELGYMIGARQEQTISVLHTQNVKPNWNFAFQYKLVSASGFFQNQNVNHNNYRFNNFYQTKNKRYVNYFAIVANKLKSGENGGIDQDEDYLVDTRYKDRFNIPVKLGAPNAGGFNVFGSTVNTGNLYNNTTFFLRQAYDWGKKDSLQVNDSTTVQLYYPKLRVQHTVQLNSSQYRYVDTRATYGAGFYDTYYNFVPLGDTFQIRDRWKELRNEVSFYQFPDSKNQQQFLRVGGVFQTLTGTLRDERLQIYNIILNGEYRNKTKNQKWDIEANGQLFANGYNAGDYQAKGRLKRFLGKKLGYLELGFENINRSPSFIYDPRSSFNLTATGGFSKENISHAFAKIDVPSIELDLTGNLYLVTNYLYFSGPYYPNQYNSLFNVVKVTADKKFNISRYWKWYTQVTVQQKTGGGPLNLPLVYTRNRFAFEGNFFKNLYLSTGLEARYNTPFKSDAYSPMTGQFYYQDTTTISNIPEVTAYFNFRIKTFTAYVRAENLNAVSLTPEFGFMNNRKALPAGYYYPGLLIRVGIFWGFIN